MGYFTIKIIFKRNTSFWISEGLLHSEGLLTFMCEPFSHLGMHTLSFRYSVIRYFFSKILVYAIFMLFVAFIVTTKKYIYSNDDEWVVAVFGVLIWSIPEMYCPCTNFFEQLDLIFCLLSRPVPKKLLWAISDVHIITLPRVQKVECKD